MIWNVIRLSTGELVMLEQGLPVPDGGVVEVVTANGDYLNPKTPEQIRAERLKQRQEMVDAIIVTTASGKRFNGDETSQTRMARAIIALNAAGVDTTTWVLADNIPTQVTVAELTEALTLAGAEQTRIWVI